MTDTDHRSRSVRDARAHFGDVVHDAAIRGRRTVITNNGRPSAVLMPLREVEDLEDRAAYADWRRDGSPVLGTLEDSARELGIVIPDAHGRGRAA
jgi:prevent-host-death family protein